MTQRDHTLHADAELPPGVLEGRATLPGLLRHRARSTPDRIALREKVRGIWQGTSWSGYFEQVRAFALYLQGIGFGAGDKLVIASDGTPEWFFADLAAQSLGGVTVGIYPTNPWPELQYIVRHCQARVAICGDQEQTDKVLEAMRRDGGLPHLEHVLTVDWKGMRHYQEPILRPFAEALAQGHALAGDPARSAAWDVTLEAVDADQDALIVYTSGTTGMPKGARISHAGIVRNAAALGQVQGFGGRPLTVVCYLPLCHVAERLMSTVMQLVYGSVVNFAESIDAVTHNLHEIGPSFFFGVPRIWEKLQQEILIRSRDARPIARRAFERALAAATPIAERTIANGGKPVSARDAFGAWLLRVTVFSNLLAGVGLDRTRVAMTGGASISPSVILFFRALGVPIYQIYGMTESSGASHSQSPAQSRLGWCGPPVPGVVEQRVADDGELQLRGPIVFNGYLHDEEATRAAFDEGWLRTGDIVELDAATGQVQIVDRKKAILITSGGKNITPSLIENALKESPYISEAVLLGDGRHFVSALIQIDLDTVGKWAQERGIAYTTYETLARLEAVNTLIAEDVKRVNERFSRVENIRKFALLRKQLDHDDGELTATMKVRRRVIEQKFAAEVAHIYGLEAA
ncbi:long-chain fatty acid--CoA ligase [Variovorax sp. dw_308]|uniref:AMP-dependent synthetase/ligase n=1 Tax=Variovorax sp. dw_308 TaxID=2721546 RepID=UPI001C4827F4|nr:AMP-binding protein [Variovorax sp. dw_308]